MTYRLDKAALDRRVQEVVQHLRDHIVVDRKRSPAWAGWHNLFTNGRIGTAGTALPLLFLHTVGEPVPERDAVLTALRESQTPDDHGAGWSILSLSAGPNVEGTTWPLRALTLAGDGGDTERILDAARWLESQQNGDGGWGSMKGNDSRVTLTTSAVGALVLGGARSRAALDAAQDWLVRTQRRTDGSWGPTAGEPGTVHHTCLVVMSLLKLGIRRTDSGVLAARRFLHEAWQPRPRDIETEVYDAHFSDYYRRVVLEHDVDALVCQTLLRLGQSGDFTAALGGVQRLLDIEFDELQVDRVSLWNLLPRAFLAHELRQLPVFGDGHVIAREGAVASIDSAKRHRPGPVFALAWSELPLTMATLQQLSMWSAAVVVVVLVALWVLGQLSFAGFLSSVALPIVLAVWAVLSQRRHE